MKVLYYECFSGISGDMNLAALLDIGVEENYLMEQLSKLNLNEYEIDISKDKFSGICGTKVEVLIKHNHSHHNNKEHNHHHRNLKDIENIINNSDLNDNIKKLSLKMFNKVAKAEAKVHGASIYEVHFHEVGAIDSIVDIVGAAICLDFLKVDKIMASTVELGSGFIKCAHGILPVPAPATVEIMKDIPIKSKLNFEATTPTGAAILSSVVDEFTDNKNFKINKIGYGIGKKENVDIPDVLRVFLAEVDEKKNILF